MSQDTKENALITAIGTKPKFKNQLRKLSPKQFAKLEAIATAGFKEVRAEIEEKERFEQEIHKTIDLSLEELALKLAIPVSEIKAHINKS